LRRCDELAEPQPTLFFELLTFPGDGVPADIARKLIGYSSALQSVSRTVSESARTPGCGFSALVTGGNKCLPNNNLGIAIAHFVLNPLRFITDQYG